MQQTFDIEISPQSALSILSWSDIESGYAGSFHCPLGQVGSDRFGYSRAAQCQLSNGNLLVSGHAVDAWRKAREITIPVSGEASAVGPWRTITANTPASIDRMAGMIEVGGQVYCTAHEWYNATGADRPSQGQEGGSAWNLVPGIHSKFCAGYMGHVPSSLSQYLYLAGNQGTSGAATNRYGPNLNAIAEDYTGVVLMQHTESNPFPGWWVGDLCGGMTWIETATHHAVLAFSYRGIDNQRYDGGIGYVASTYEVECMLFDPADLLEVLGGTRNPWDVTPYEIAVLVDTSNTPQTPMDLRWNADSGQNNITCSFRDGRLIVMREKQVLNGEYVPKGWVFEVN